jgi:methylglutaconyl-CoA hydratase
MNKLAIIDHGPIREIRLQRPDVHNAFDPELIAALKSAFTEASQADLRGVLLSSVGKSFCAGADLEYMRSIASWGEQENLADAQRLSAMLRSIRECPHYVIARVHGAALGGGTGLLAACDLVIASSEAIFGFTEARLGILPAVISPFVIERIGAAHARAHFPTGVRFGTQEALRIGLVDQVVAPAELDDSVARAFGALLAAAPQAAREAKSLVASVAASLPLQGENPIFAETAKRIARLRASEEAQEGMRAFFEKRPPRWVTPVPPLTTPSDHDL